MVSKIRIRPHKLAVLLLALCSSVLVLFNSCQGPIGSASLSQGFNSAQCADEPGLVRKLNLTVSEKQSLLKAQDSIFDQRKLILGHESQGMQKASDQALPSGTELSVLIDNECLENLKSSPQATAFSYQVANGKMALDDLKLQAYDYVLDQNWLSSEFEQLLNDDLCVKGVTYNKTYHSTAFSSAGLLNDSYQDKQLHFASLNAPASYSKFYDLDNGMAVSGEPVVVAVLDTGIDWTHADLASNIQKVTVNNQSFWGLNAPTLSTGLVDYNPRDDSDVGHGSHVAGIIAAVSDNKTGITGLMPFRAKIMAVKVFKLVDYPNNVKRLETTTTIISNAIRWAADRNAHVINLSLARLESINGSNTGRDPIYEDALTYAINAGSFVVAAVGNATSTYAAQEINSTSFTSLPARYGAEYAGMLSVGSYNAGDGNRSSFSHWGTQFVEIGAPGTQNNGTGNAAGIFSTQPKWVGAETGYGVLEGTSMSAPMVSAAAALTIGLIREAYGQVPNPAEVERILLASAQKSSSLSNFFKDGNRLDLKSLVDKINKDYPLTKGGADSSDQPSINCP